MATQKKVDQVNELADKVGKAKSVVFADYRGLKHKQLEELRKKLKKVEGEFTVSKNRLLLRALGEKAEDVKSFLTDSTATLFAYGDEVAPLKELMKFFKAAAMGKTKGGLLGNATLSDADVTKLATLPTREVILGQVVGRLNGPIQGLHYGLSWNLNKLVWALNNLKIKNQN